MERRAFFASAGAVAAVTAFKEEHKLEGGEVFHLQAGDVLLFRVSWPMSQADVERMAEDVRTHLGDYKVMVLPSDMDVSVLRPE